MTGEPFAAWPRDRLLALTDLCRQALPGEGLDQAALATCCFEGGGVVLGDHAGRAAAVIAPGRDPRSWHLQLLVVAPQRRGQGVGRALLDAAREVAAAAGATSLVLGGSAAGGRYLWPGVEDQMVAMRGLAESHGAAWGERIENLSCASSVRAPLPDGVRIDHRPPAESASQGLAWIAAAWPRWHDEAARAVERGTFLLAVAADRPIGFACHSVNRPGWFGPTAVDPGARGRGVGAALLAEACRDLAAAGHERVEIAWIGPAEFYAKVAGATPSRTFRSGWLTVRPDDRARRDGGGPTGH